MEDKILHLQGGMWQWYRDAVKPNTDNQHVIDCYLFQQMAGQVSGERKRKRRRRNQGKLTEGKMGHLQGGMWQWYRDAVKPNTDNQHVTDLL